MDFADFARGIAALALTLGLIGLAAVLARRYGPTALFRLQQPKAQSRLSVVETLMLDPARRLVLVRWAPSRWPALVRTVVTPPGPFAFSTASAKVKGLRSRPT